MQFLVRELTGDNTGDSSTYPSGHSDRKLLLEEFTGVDPADFRTYPIGNSGKVLSIHVNAWVCLGSPNLDLPGSSRASSRIGRFRLLVSLQSVSPEWWIVVSHWDLP
jgi:hypothetical protein